MPSDLPSGIKPAHAREAGGLPAGLPALLILSALIGAAVLGLLGGTRSERTSAASPATTIAIEHPRVLRSGMVFEARVDLTARAAIGDATIALSPALWRSITINTEMPQASEEEYSDGFYRLHFGPLAAGKRVHLKLDAQINPDLFAGTRGKVAAFDGDRLLVELPVEMRVLP